jgi:hypothetical protein
MLAPDARWHRGICEHPAALHQFLSTLLDALHLQAKEIERLTSHVEQQTDAMLTPSPQRSA